MCIHSPDPHFYKRTVQGPQGKCNRQSLSLFYITVRTWQTETCKVQCVLLEKLALYRTMVIFNGVLPLSLASFKLSYRGVKLDPSEKESFSHSDMTFIWTVGKFSLGGKNTSMLKITAPLPTVTSWHSQVGRHPGASPPPLEVMRKGRLECTLIWRASCRTWALFFPGRHSIKPYLTLEVIF